MKAKKFNILLLGVLLGLTPVLTSAQNQVTKEYHEEYGTADYSKLILQNKYGSVDIQNWDSPSIKIDVPDGMELTHVRMPCDIKSLACRCRIPAVR